jgi:hypothetical protein
MDRLRGDEVIDRPFGEEGTAWAAGTEKIEVAMTSFPPMNIFAPRILLSTPGEDDNDRQVDKKGSGSPCLEKDDPDNLLVSEPLLRDLPLLDPSSVEIRNFEKLSANP